MQQILGHIEQRPLPTRREFIELCAAGRPVLFTNVVAAWPAMKLWSPAWLAEWLATHRQDQMLAVRVQRGFRDTAATEGRRETARVPAREFVPAVASHDEAGTDVLRYWSAMLPREWRSHVAFPDFALHRALCEVRVWIGSGRTLTGLHQDHSHNLFAQVVGRKRFQLYPPDAARALQPLRCWSVWAAWAGERGDTLAEMVANTPVAPAYDVVVEPGDLLFVPYDWFHRVTGEGFSWSVSRRWFTPKMLVVHGADIIRENVALRLGRSYAECGQLVPTQ